MQDSLVHDLGDVSDEGWEEQFCMAAGDEKENGGCSNG